MLTHIPAPIEHGVQPAPILSVQEIIREAYETREQGGARAARREKGRRVAIVTLYNDLIAPYAVWSNACVRLYAAEHGYALITVRSLLSSRAPQWDKVKAMEILLNDAEASAAYDYFMWIDADAAFAQLKKPLLESVIDLYMNKEHETRDFLVCDDSPQTTGGEGSTPEGLIHSNTGTFVMRSCQWSRDFATRWWNNPMGFEMKPLHEQHVLNKLYANADPNDNNDLKKRLVLAPARVLNSAFSGLPWGSNPGENTFVVHMMARKSIDRRNVFRAMFERLKTESTLEPNSVALPDRFEHFAQIEIPDTENNQQSHSLTIILLLTLCLLILSLCFLVLQRSFFSRLLK